MLADTVAALAQQKIGLLALWGKRNQDISAVYAQKYVGGSCRRLKGEEGFARESWARQQIEIGGPRSSGSANIGTSCQVSTTTTNDEKAKRFEYQANAMQTSGRLDRSQRCQNEGHFALPRNENFW